MTSHSDIRWGILAPGSIARRFAGQLPRSVSGRLVAVASRDARRAEAFAEEFGAERAHASYEALLDDPEVDAVYIASPHTHHAQWVVAAARAGKHVLCEKPLTPSPSLTMAAIEAARENGVALLEAFMYRFHPQVVRVLALVRTGAIGEVEHVDAGFSFSVAPNGGRLFSPELAGGGILDVGCYPVSFAHFVALAAGEDAGAPVRVAARGTVTPNGIDEWASASLEFGNGMTAHVSCGIRNRDAARARIYGSRGYISLPSPWVVDPDSPAVIEVGVVGEELQTIELEPAAAYALEADALAAARKTGQAPEVTWADSLAISTILQQWRDAIGARYPHEAPTASAPVVAGGPLRRRQNAVMSYGAVNGVDKPVSRLVMGCDNQRTIAHAAVMFDDFFERGGNTFDTAWQYGGGLMEQLLGRWVSTRGVREEVVVIAKGAHTPHCDPESLTRELLESLERLEVEYADMYFMHRDNPDIPVGEFVDVLDEHYRAGRVRAFGGSNWTTARIDEANRYARENGKQGFTILSNHFGLAQAIELPWKGCQHATDPESKAWLERTGTPLFPWSSQARGFFSRADPEDTSDPQLVRCYYSDGNFERLRRARALASERRVEPTAVALAYVLQQPFPTFPLIGPRTVTETRTSLAALDVVLTPEEVRWLDLRD
ncbi:aldo/keto reductase [Microbacterium sp. ET2]|uniref:aldo/keto reductase n=1 Tax=Microbacterium albipurpureum TaxID=3050384 RepID=UPI00259CA817|nr:aldo/keto reductase [Microbacterium sp. ET2 (Ac-2212)]WJL96764.1 aldo/keto reductase [Microbacterium sp. ET2 (Ac-2212)]